MELTLKRLAFAALALAAVLLPLRKERSGSVAPSTGDRTLRLDSLYRQRRTAHISWSAFDLRDSAMRLLATGRAGTGQPAIVWRGFTRAASNTGADSVVAELWDRIGATNPGVSVAVLAYNIGKYQQPSYTGALITKAGDRTSCVAIAPAGTDQDGELQLWGSALARALAPCAVLATFGAPGTGVGSWLAATGYAAAQSNQWLIPSTAEFTHSPWIEWDEVGAGPWWPEGLFRWMQPTGLFDLARLVRPPYFYGASGLRCINGDEGACVTSVLHSAIVLPAPDSMPQDVTLSAWLTSPRNTTVATVRPPGPQMIAALITEFGRERFQKFWASSAPFETAFHDAFGETLGSWTTHWAKHEWLGSYDAKHINADILLGVTLKPSWLPPIIAWSALALAVATWVARRRTA